MLKKQSYHQFQRITTRKIKIGSLFLGGDAPIVVQSMTTSDTMDTKKTAEEIIQLKEVGCQMVRVTVPSLKAAENLENIKNQLVKKNCNLPLVADVHFTPSAAIKAASIVEKVRINPGNFQDRKHFKDTTLNEQEYKDAIKRISDKFIPLLEICKEHNTALRIGANHGSLSDRIVTRYGDSPLGMVHSALEFLDIAEEQNFHNIVFSMKSSNVLIMIAAYRLLVKELENRGKGLYPLHLGVTEAGDGDDGRIKSTLGIGTLLNDGLGDTIRVSLTEDSAYEIPVAQKIINYFNDDETIPALKPVTSSINPYAFFRQKTKKIFTLGDAQSPKVFLSLKEISRPSILAPWGITKNEELDKWETKDVAPDFIITEKKLKEEELKKNLPPDLKVFFQVTSYSNTVDQKNDLYYFSSLKEYQEKITNNELYLKTINIIKINYQDLSALTETSFARQTIFLLEEKSFRAAWVLRNLIFHIKKLGFSFPLLLTYPYEKLPKLTSKEDKVVAFSSYFGPLFMDGLVDGILLQNGNPEDLEIAFKILQAARQRIFKTEYISCPSCGRTLFDLQEVTAKIKEETEHLKGVKIAIMGCIVNGPGEMADADFGYVGSGPGKITLYKSKEPVLKNVPSQKAVNELIALLKKEGVWRDKNLTH